MEVGPMLQTRLSETDARYHKRLVDQINQSDRAVQDAYVALAKASLQSESATKAMTTWMAHIAEVYDLLPQDGVDMTGAFSFMDPGWPERLRAMREAAEGIEVPAVVTPLPEEPPAGVVAVEACPVPEPVLPEAYPVPELCPIPELVDYDPGPTEDPVLDDVLPPPEENPTPIKSVRSHRATRRPL